MKRKNIAVFIVALMLVLPVASGCGNTNTTVPEDSTASDFEERMSDSDELHVSDGIIPQVISRNIEYVRHDPGGDYEIESIEVTDWVWEDGFILLDSAWMAETDDATSLYPGLNGSYSGKPAELYIHFDPDPFSNPSVDIVKDDDLNSHVDISLRTSCDVIFRCDGEVYFFDDVPVTGASIYQDGSLDTTIDIGNGEEILSVPPTVTSITTDDFLSAITLEDRLRAESSTYITTINFADETSIEVTSDDLNDGIWDEVITNTNYGENRSPELSWDEVEGASCYQVIMIDGAWLHMDVLTEAASLESGSVGQGSRGERYVGPYPPSGTHTYSIFVFALRDDPGSVRLLFDNENNSINRIFDDLDTDVNGESGNVLAYGRLDGNYSHHN